MNEARNKPRVFLSHSKRDIAFVQRVYDDLRRCQIDPWLDSEEIRHGQPWLDAIFESGIPTCDCVLVYLTPSSLESPLVKKEIDASLIAKLRDNRILFLPYVSAGDVRGRLRPDIQTLQTPVWNEGNYHDLLPRVVSEVWRGFMERTTLAVADAEKVKRLEAELEIERLRSERAGVFSEGEDRDFRYIWNALNRWEPVTVSKVQGEAGKQTTIEKLEIWVHIQSLVPFLAGPQRFEQHSDSVQEVLQEQVKPLLPLKEDATEKIAVRLGTCPDLSKDLLMFGLVERRENPRYQTKGDWWDWGGRPYTFVYTDKMERFKYWMSFNGVLPTEVKWSSEPPEPEA